MRTDSSADRTQWPRRGSTASRLLAGVLLGAILLAAGWSAFAQRASGVPGTPPGAVLERAEATVEPPAAAGLVINGPTAADDWAGFPVEPERPAPHFSLTDQAGQPWALSSARGQVVALFFGYTRCPDVCPMTMAILRQAVAQLGENSDDVRVVLVTTDPMHDTPEILGRYVAGYDPRFVALTGPGDAARAAADLFGALPETDAAATNGHDNDEGDHQAEAGDHSSRVWLIDAYGQMRVSFVGAYTPDDVAHDVTLLLQERR